MKKVFAIAATAITLAAPQPAQANDLATALGAVVAGAIIADALRLSQPNVVIVNPQHPKPYGYHRQVDPRQICHVDRIHRGHWVDLVHRNCYGETLSIQTIPRY